jgi:tetratricopeptide (TPR) repeat protein
VFLFGAVLVVSCARDPQETARGFAARGDDFVRNGRDAAALIEYRNAVRAWPAWSDAYQKLGDTYDRLGRSDDAYASYVEGARVGDEEPLAQNEDALRALVTRRPALVPARLALAELLLLRNDTADAEEQLRAATAAEPANELANRSLAAIYIANGRMKEAENCLKIAAAQNPDQYRSRLALADFLMAERRYAEARASLEQARKDRQLEGAVKLRLAAIDYEEGRIDPAERAVSELLETNATAETWTLQAQFQFRERKLDEALASAREALALDPQLVPAQNLADAIRRQQIWR